MTGKLGLTLGFAAGYVLGTKAGRERYDQIVAASRQLWGNPTVQSTAGVLQAQATDLVSKAKQTVRGDKASETSGYGDLSSTATTTTDYYEPASMTSNTTDRPGTNGITP